MEMRDMLIMHWICILVIATILWAHLRGFFAIWNSPRLHHLACYSMVRVGHRFIVLFFMGVMYVCQDYDLHPVSLFQLSRFHPFYMFNSIIVGRTTSVDM